MKSLYWLLFALLVLLIVTVQARAQQPAHPFQATYRELSDRLTAFEQSLPAPLDTQHTVTFGAELLTANAHSGEELLSENGFKGNLLMLERLQALGVQGVTVQIAYPVLSKDFPRSAEYLAFYKRLNAEIKLRGLKLHIKTGPLFREREYTTVRVDYRTLTLEKYFAERQRMAQVIVTEIQPDYLTIGNEPSTETMVTGLPISIQQYTGFIQDTLKAVGKTNTLIGAGSGAWDDIRYIKSFAEHTALDFIDLHIYPVAGPAANYLEVAKQAAMIARANNKRIIIGEVWLYKSAAAELKGNPSASTFFARDAFSLWEPLDQQMLKAIVRFAQVYGVDYVSPFWTKHFFAYVPYTPATARLTPQQILALSSRKAATQMMANQYSTTGKAYQQLIRQYGARTP